MQSGYARNALVLGLLSAMGPFAIDMYLPAMPRIAADLDASIASTQASLMVFMGAVALCQIIYGPVSDMVGRRAPLYFGGTLFVIGSIGCALAPTIEALIGFRFLQGIGACATMIVPRAIVRDLHTGPDAARISSEARSRWSRRSSSSLRFSGIGASSASSASARCRMTS